MTRPLGRLTGRLSCCPWLPGCCLCRSTTAARPAGTTDSQTACQSVSQSVSQPERRMLCAQNGRNTSCAVKPTSRKLHASAKPHSLSVSVSWHSTACGLGLHRLPHASADPWLQITDRAQHTCCQQVTTVLLHTCSTPSRAPIRLGRPTLISAGARAYACIWQLMGDRWLQQPIACLMCRIQAVPAMHTQGMHACFALSDTDRVSQRTHRAPCRC